MARPKTSRKWTQDQLAKLREMWPTNSGTIIAAKVDHTPRAVTCKARVLGLLNKDRRKK